MHHFDTEKKHIKSEEEKNQFDSNLISDMV